MKKVGLIFAVLLLGALMMAGCGAAQEEGTPTPSPAAEATPSPSPTATIDKSRPTNIEKYYEFTREDWDELSDAQKKTLVSTFILDEEPDVEDNDRNRRAEALVDDVDGALTGSNTLKDAFDAVYTAPEATATPEAE